MKPLSHLYSVLLIIISSSILLSLTIYNGFPFVFADSGTYLSTAIEAFDKRWLSTSWNRPPFYSIFVFILHMKYSLWPIVIAQAFIISHLIYLTLRVMLGVIQPLTYILIIVILSLLTSLPWIVGQITPDLFTGIVILGLYLLAFKKNDLNKAEYIYLILLTASSISFHFSHIPLALGLCFLILISYIFIYRSWKKYLLSATSILLPLILAITALMSVHFLSKGEAAVSTHGHLFLLARSLEDGPAMKYLEDECSIKQYRLCQYLDQLGGHPAEFLWDKDSPIYKIGVNDIRTEAKVIVENTLKKYPVWSFILAIKATLTQFVTFDTGTWLKQYINEEGASINTVINTYFNSSYTAYANSIQNTGKLPITSFIWIHRIAIIVAIFLLLGASIYLKARKSNALFIFLAFIVIGLLINAFVCGALSLVTDRYQSRIIWLIVFLCTIFSIYTCKYYSFTRQEQSSSTQET